MRRVANESLTGVAESPGWTTSSSAAGAPGAIYCSGQPGETCVTDPRFLRQIRESKIIWKVKSYVAWVRATSSDLKP
mgnify:CR=1 FL=1